MCGMSISSVDPRIWYDNNSDAELLGTNISTPSKNRMTISTLFMKFNLYGLVTACIQEAPAKNAPWNIDVLEDERW